MADTKKHNAHSKHRERMRTRFSESGFDNYSPHEVLEQLLFDCLPRVNTNTIGHELIDRFGSVMGVLRADPSELCKVSGIGKRSAEYIASIRPTVGRLICEQYRSMPAVNTEMTAFLSDWFYDKITGTLGLIACGADGVFVGFYELTFGDGTNADFDSAELAREISTIVGEGKYILVFCDSVPKSSVYRLLDESRELGSVMTNAYLTSGNTPVSLLF